MKYFSWTLVFLTCGVAAFGQAAVESAILTGASAGAATGAKGAGSATAGAFGRIGEIVGKGGAASGKASAPQPLRSDLDRLAGHDAVGIALGLVVRLAGDAFGICDTPGGHVAGVDGVTECRLGGVVEGLGTPLLGRVRLGCGDHGVALGGGLAGDSLRLGGLGHHEGRTHGEGEQVTGGHGHGERIGRLDLGPTRGDTSLVRLTTKKLERRLLGGDGWGLALGLDGSASW